MFALVCELSSVREPIRGKAFGPIAWSASSRAGVAAGYWTTILQHDADAAGRPPDDMGPSVRGSESVARGGAKTPEAWGYQLGALAFRLPSDPEGPVLEPSSIRCHRRWEPLLSARFLSHVAESGLPPRFCRWSSVHGLCGAAVLAAGRDEREGPD
jgi:hypothetical protein